jgi:hypothetical protein
MEAIFDEGIGVDLTIGHAGMNGGTEVGEILLPFTGAEVNAETASINAGSVGTDTGIFHGHLAGSQGENGISRKWRPGIDIVKISVQVKAMNLGGDAGGESSGIKKGDRANATDTLLQGLPGRFHVPANRSDHPDTCHDYSSTHFCLNPALSNSRRLIDPGSV